MKYKHLIGLLFMVPMWTHAVVIELDLVSSGEYSNTEYNNNFEIVNQTTIDMTSEQFQIELSINTASGTGPVQSANDAGQYIQHTSIIDYSDASFDLFTPFVETFDPFLDGALTSDFQPLQANELNVDYQVFFNETTDPGFIGGDASIRFSQSFTYDVMDSQTGERVSEFFWLAGRLFLFNIDSKDEFDRYKDVPLDDLLDNIDGAYVFYNTIATRFDNTSCLLACGDDDVVITDFFGSSNGTSSLASVPEPMTLSMFFPLMILMLIRRSAR